MTRKRIYTRLSIGLMVAALSFWNFTNLEGFDSIRNIQIVTLLVCGVGLGVALSSLLSIFSKPQ